LTAFAVFVAGRPVPQGSLRHVGRGRLVHDSPKLQQWRRDIAWTVRAEVGAMTLDASVPVGVRCAFNLHPKRKGDSPDLDKLVRAVLDALTMVAFVDDKQVVSIEAQRHLIADEPEGLALWAQPSPFASEAKAKPINSLSKSARV
jgi:crossover junction endodeoxyribonuclease RusA